VSTQMKTCIYHSGLQKKPIRLNWKEFKIKIYPIKWPIFNIYIIGLKTNFFDFKLLASD
jgi:hypothetical protein